MSNVHVKGLKELDKFLAELGSKMEKNIMRAALRDGAKEILEEAKRLAPVGEPNARDVKRYGNRPGTLRDSLRVTTRYRKGTVTASVKAGGKAKGGGDAYYARWVEYGVKPHGIKKGARRSSGKYQDGVLHPGNSPQPFMRPALDGKAAEALRAVGDGIKKRLTKAGLEGAGDIEIELGDE